MSQQQHTPNSPTSTQTAFEGLNRADNKPSPKPLLPLNNEVQETYNDLSQLAKKETWENKARFPPNLRAPLFKCAKLALDTRSSGYVIEENFFAHLQNILPYNKFTLKKLVYKNILPQWSNDLENQRDSMIGMFRERVEVDGAVCGLTVKDTDNQDNDEFATILKELSFVDPTAYKQESESNEQTMEQAYIKILSCFPEGWVTSEEIKTQYTKLKEKISNQEKEEKKQQARDQQKPTSASTPSTRKTPSTSNPTSPTEQAASVSKYQDSEVNEVEALSSPKADAYRPISPILSPVSVATPVSRESQSRFLNVSESGPQLGHNRCKDEDIRRGSGSVQRDYFHRNDEYRNTSPNSPPVDQQLQQQRKLILHLNSHPPTPAPSAPALIRRLMPGNPVSASQYLRQLPPFPLPLPPSPISPQTLSTAIVSSTESSTKTPKIAIGATKRTNDDQGRVEYTQSRQLRGSAMPTHPSMAGPSHQEIYESLLHSKGGPVKKVRVDNGPGLKLVGDMVGPADYRYAERTPSSHAQQHQQMQMTLHHHARKQELLGHTQSSHRQRILGQQNDEVQIIEKNQINGYHGGAEYDEARRERSREHYHAQQEQMRHRREKGTDVGMEAQRRQLKLREMMELQTLEEQERLLLQQHQQRRLEQITRSHGRELDVREHQYRVQQSHLATRTVENPQRSMERSSLE
ncbi:hypothetical protein BGX26_000600 [Mortierella sp. AD094]|nr:hypothetical protein BGX26_000600 [Mortierella sp. AD094]